MDQSSGPQTSPSAMLVVAALERELAAVRHRANRNLRLLVTGEGIANAERKLSEALRQSRPRAVVWIGFAGALAASLRIGDLVLISRVEGRSEALPPTTLVRAAESMPVERMRTGVAVTVEDIVCASGEKQRLAKSVSEGELAVVDMESSAVARVCAEQHLPFLIVRAVSDLFDEDLPLDFNRCRSAEGRVSTFKVMLAAAARPAAVRGLLELSRRSKICAGRLADFVEQFGGLVGE
jgi:adenosylhomocysteine nucleosidase